MHCVAVLHRVAAPDGLVVLRQRCGLRVAPILDAHLSLRHRETVRLGNRGGDRVTGAVCGDRGGQRGGRCGGGGRDRGERRREVRGGGLGKDGSPTEGAETNGIRDDPVPCSFPNIIC
jgi:hypothetical protein